MKKKVGSKIFQTKNFYWKKFSVEKNFAVEKKISVEKNFAVEKKFLSKKSLGQKKRLFKRKFWSKKNFLVKKNFVKKFLIKKVFGSFESENIMLSKKNPGRVNPRWRIYAGRLFPREPVNFVHRKWSFAHEVSLNISKLLINLSYYVHFVQEKSS